MEKVSLIACENYEYNKVKKAIDESFINLGGIDKFIKAGDKVLLKINLLMKKKPEEATTTHPVFVEALIRAIQEAGGIVTIADSPGGLYNERVLKSIYSFCGIADVAKRTGAILNYDTSFEELAYPEGELIKSFPIIRPVLDADIVITVPKLKTHGMTLYTGAVKNLFGTIPGTYKAEYHFRMQDKKDFCNMLVDLCQLVKPQLTFMDAIIGMEGNGPSGGSPRKIAAVLAGENPYAVDLIAASIIGIKPDEVYTIANSIRRGLCPPKISNIIIEGDALEDFKISDYKLPDSKSVDFLEGWPKFIQKRLNRWLSPKPVFIHELCIGCRDCEKNCPPKVIQMVDNKPYVNLNECIKCFCCQELCPKKAVEIKRAKWVERLLR